MCSSDLGLSSDSLWKAKSLKIWRLSTKMLSNLLVLRVLRKNVDEVRLPKITFSG